MATVDPKLAQERFGTALDLYDLAERMLRQKLRRKHPDATGADIEAMIAAWQARRPAAEHGDGEGTPVAWPPHPPAPLTRSDS